MSRVSRSYLASAINHFPAEAPVSTDLRLRGNKRDKVDLGIFGVLGHVRNRAVGITWIGFLGVDGEHVLLRNQMESLWHREGFDCDSTSSVNEISSHMRSKECEPTKPFENLLGGCSGLGHCDMQVDMIRTPMNLVSVRFLRAMFREIHAHEVTTMLDRSLMVFAGGLGSDLHVRLLVLKDPYGGVHGVGWCKFCTDATNEFCFLDDATNHLAWKGGFNYDLRDEGCESRDNVRIHGGRIIDIDPWCVRKG